MCDNHGFPSHAWEQPFGGGGSPWYTSYWIPQALVYAYLPAVRSPHYPQHGEAADAVYERLLAGLGADPEIAAWNRIHADRYLTYMARFLPERFATSYDRGVLLYRSTYEPKEDGTPTGLASMPGAYPRITTMSITTEVADETAQGRYMALCARAHLLADRALLQYLFDADPAGAVRHERLQHADGRTLLRATRPRPVRPGALAG